MASDRRDPSGRRIFAILVTYRRPHELATALERLEHADPRPDHVLVMDNAPDASGRRTVERIAHVRDPWVEYHEMPANLGPAGARAVGMAHVLERARDDDVIVLLDDDDPLPDPELLGTLRDRVGMLERDDPRFGGIALRGGRFDRRVGRAKPVVGKTTGDLVEVDYLHGGFFPMFPVHVVRSAGTYLAPLLFGWADLEFGLRLHACGYRLYVAADLWRRHASSMGHPPEPERRSVRLGPADVRRYYTLRNMLFVLGRYGAPGSRWRYGAVVGIGKPLANLPVAPREALKHLRVSIRAIVDGARGKLGPAPVSFGTGSASGH